MNSPSVPLVSVGIPTYNQSEYLRQAIQSVLKQTIQDFEIVVVDDCSTDNTADVVQQFNDSRIRYVRTEFNLRPPRSWNECLRLSRGKYFALLPHDDLYNDKFLEQMVEALELTTDVGYAQCAHALIVDKNRTLEERRLSDKRIIERGEKALLVQTQRHLMNPVSILFRGNCIRKHGPWDVDYWDDEVLILKIAFHEGFVYMPSILSYVREHSENLSKILLKEGADTTLNVINQQTAIFAAVLPMTESLMKLRNRWNRQLGYSCLFFAIKAAIRFQWRVAILFINRSLNIYPAVLCDPRLYFLAISKIISRI